jgi:hypothetical protein
LLQAIVANAAVTAASAKQHLPQEELGSERLSPNQAREVHLGRPDHRGFVDHRTQHYRAKDHQ